MWKLKVTAGFLKNKNIKWQFQMESEIGKINRLCSSNMKNEKVEVSLTDVKDIRKRTHYSLIHGFNRYFLAISRAQGIMLHKRNETLKTSRHSYCHGGI